MDRICPNCGRPMNEFDPICGPGGMGCLYCTKQCPNCHKEVFDQDIIYGDSKTYCKYCQEEVIKEDSLDDEDDIELDNGLDSIDEETLNKFRNMSKEELDEQIQTLYNDVMDKIKSQTP